MTKSVEYYGSPQQAQLKAKETLDRVDQTSLNLGNINLSFSV